VGVFCLVVGPSGVPVLPAGAVRSGPAGLAVGKNDGCCRKPWDYPVADAGHRRCVPAANILWSPWLGYIAFFLGMAAALWGWRQTAVEAFGPAGLMLLVILPPPLGWDQTLILWLRSVR